MNIIIGADHGGVALKQHLIGFLEGKGNKVKNMGVDSEDPVDYPDIAAATCREYKKGEYDFGILVCGTGIGASIAANKIQGIRCANLCDNYAARMAKSHNNANFIAFGGRMSYAVPAVDMVSVFMETSFSGGRHQVRVDKIMALNFK